MSHETAKRQEYTETPVQTVYTRMSELLGISIKSEADIWRVMQTGISARRLKHLMKRLRLAPGAVGPETTIRRRLHRLQVLEASQKAITTRRAKYKGAETRIHDSVKAHGRVAVMEEPRLNPFETERLTRLTRVVSEATQLFGDEKTALDWLYTPADFLHDEKPIQPMKLAETESGARMVESMISRTVHGFF